MNMYLFFKNLNILCIFSDRFFDPVFFRFRFLGSTGSMTGSVLVTLEVASSVWVSRSSTFVNFTVIGI
jgi:predicted Abi (CAAX) family protease